VRAGEEEGDCLPMFPPLFFVFFCLGGIAAGFRAGWLHFSAVVEGFLVFLDLFLEKNKSNIPFFDENATS
jgi:hypothetical protein